MRRHRVVLRDVAGSHRHLLHPARRGAGTASPGGGAMLFRSGVASRCGGTAVAAVAGASWPRGAALDRLGRNDDSQDGPPA